ncbi:hypothetical protein QUF58_14965 [Anaerolineales bacterium HSG24]|nr:hypothetical protein [Anaerolineales bacterium HSG24]
MAKRSQQKRQKASIHKKARRKKSQAKTSSGSLRTPSAKDTSTWPLQECLVSENWQNSEEICQIYVARQSPQGHVSVAGFIVDLACLGIKNGFANLYPSRAEYNAHFRNKLLRQSAMVDVDLNLAAKILQVGKEYAHSLGFKPHPDTRDAFKIMGKTYPEKCHEKIPTGGPEGKPFFIAGPYDDAEKIMAILNRNVGEGNYTYLVPISEEGLFR